MSTNTATLNNFHPCAPKRKLENYADIINCKRPHTKKPYEQGSSRRSIRTLCGTSRTQRHNQY